MQINIEQIWQRFNELTQREKLMVICSALMTIGWAWDSFFYQALQTQNQAIESELLSLQTQITAKQQAIKEISAIVQYNPNANNRQQLNELQQSVDRMKDKLAQGDKKFVPASAMAYALKDIIKQQGTLKLVALETLPVTSFPNADEKDPWIFRHTLLLTLEGDYFSTLDYLKMLESLPWRIHWDNINYQVKNYPTAEIHIQLYTLSFEKDWLGV